jgi:hypothetical protein
VDKYKWHYARALVFAGCVSMILLALIVGTIVSIHTGGHRGTVDWLCAACEFIDDMFKANTR